jgi:hypothetical protein
MMSAGPAEINPYGYRHTTSALALALALPVIMTLSNILPPGTAHNCITVRLVT